MKIAVISDIHGNIFSLEKFLIIAKEESFDEIICLGDVLDPFEESLEVYELLKARKIPILRGNHEDYTIRFHKDSNHESWWKADKRSIAFVAQRMGALRAKELEALPYSVTREFSSNLRIYFCHASPWSNSESYFDQWHQQMKDSIQKIESEVLIGGHKHVCFERTFGGKKLICAPSLGIPQSGLARAQYLVLEMKANTLQHRFESFEYDNESVLKQYLCSKWFDQGAPFSWLLADEILCGKRRVGPLLRRMRIKFGALPTEENWRTEIYDYLVEVNRLNLLENFCDRKYWQD